MNTNEHTVLDQVANHARRLIANQALYQLSLPELRPRWDEWYENVDRMKPADFAWANDLVLKHPLCEYNSVIELVASMPIEDLFDEDAWADSVSDYIFLRNASGEDIVRAIIARTGWQL